MKALVLEDVYKIRGSGARAVQVLHGVSLAVEAGEFVLLEGPSGSGKTTLLAVAGGILTPESGKVFLEGQPLHGGARAADRSRRAGGVGFVFQRSNLLPQLSVEENILLMGRIAGMKAAAARRESEDLLRRLSIFDLRHRYPRELSCGEEQRVAVARALVHRPGIVLADEPTGNLDSQAGRTVAESLAELAKARGSAVVVATHDVRLAPFASRRIKIEDGRLRPEGGPEASGKTGDRAPSRT
jgi:putative ABC transport system ATP-binding protein